MPYGAHLSKSLASKASPVPLIPACVDLEDGVHPAGIIDNIVMHNHAQVSNSAQTSLESTLDLFVIQSLTCFVWTSSLLWHYVHVDDSEFASLAFKFKLRDSPTSLFGQLIVGQLLSEQFQASSALHHTPELKPSGPCLDVQLLRLLVASSSLPCRGACSAIALDAAGTHAPARVATVMKTGFRFERS